MSRIIVRNNIYLYGIRGEGKSATHRAEAFMRQKRFDATKIHTHTFALDDLPTALRYAKERVEDAIKVVVKARGVAAVRECGGEAAEAVRGTIAPRPRSRLVIGERDEASGQTMLICDEYLTPASLDEAFDAMAAHRGRYRIVAGATDTLPWAREGRAGDVEIPVLIDVAKIPELSERRVDGTRVRLGAATPIQRFLDDPALVQALPGHAALRGVVRRRPDPRIRHHRRQHRQCLAGRRRHAAADRA